MIIWIILTPNYLYVTIYLSTNFTIQDIPMIQLNNELEDLNNKILAMGGLVETAIHKSMRALIENNTQLAQEVREEENTINALDIEIDKKAMDLIALMQPVAGDMRLVVTAMKLTTDLERIGDKAADIAKRVIELNKGNKTDFNLDIIKISNLVENMTESAIQSFIQRDAELARQVIRSDDEVDNLTGLAMEKIVSIMSKDTNIINEAMKMHAVMRYLERIADHATNISEMVIYLIEGDIIRHSTEIKKPE